MRSDVAILFDILEAARAAVSYLGEIQLDDLRKDVMRVRAIERELEIIGEATKRISLEFRTKHPEFSWRDMAGLRDVLVHQYDQVQIKTLWDIVKDNLPDLIQKIEPLVPEEPDDAG